MTLSVAAMAAAVASMTVEKKYFVAVIITLCVPDMALAATAGGGDERIDKLVARHENILRKDMEQNRRKNNGKVNRNDSEFRNGICKCINKSTHTEKVLL